MFRHPLRGLLPSLFLVLCALFVTMLEAGDVGTFIQFNDFHFDEGYTVNGSTKLYCRGEVPLEERDGCGLYGTPLTVSKY